MANLASERAALAEKLEEEEKKAEKKVVVKAVANATGFYYTASQGTGLVE